MKLIFRAIRGSPVEVGLDERHDAPHRPVPRVKKRRGKFYLKFLSRVNKTALREAILRQLRADLALQVGAAVSVAAIGSLFFAVLGADTGERAYAHAFSIAQWVVSAGLGLGMFLAIPPRLRRVAG
jgi:hypothetical protein